MGVDVFDRLVFDVHGFAGILEGVERFFEVGFGGADAGNHVGIGVASETFLQDPGKFGVPKCDELILLFLNSR